jgi:TatD DNase family protein
VIDSHTHLDSCEPPNDELVAAARSVGVRRILTVGMDAESCRSATAAAERFPEVFMAAGRHPNLAEGYDDRATALIESFAAHERCRAVGETGLDYFRDRAQKADQQRAFEAQIEIARALDKPLIIHSRAAEDDTIRTLRERAQGLRVILHCFSMPDQLDACLEQPLWWISFAGNVTYPSAGDLASAAERVPDNRLLVETDAPYLSPQAVRKERNQPAFVVDTAQFVAERRGMTYTQLEDVVERNAAELFGW